MKKKKKNIQYQSRTYRKFAPKLTKIKLKCFFVVNWCLNNLTKHTVLFQSWQEKSYIENLLKKLLVIFLWDFQIHPVIVCKRIFLLNKNDNLFNKKRIKN